MSISISNQQLLHDLSYYSKKIVEKHLAVGPGGNTSIKEGNYMWISPSGYSLDDIPDHDWIPVNIETGESFHPTQRPSSEVAMHLEIYRQRNDVSAIVHTHPPYTIGVTSTEYNEIPPMFPDYVALVGKVPYINYVVPCSFELAQAVIHVLKNPSFSSLFLKNHGLITLGTNMKQAYYRTEIIEDAAKVFWVSKTVGTPNILPVEETQKILDSEAEKFRQNLLNRS